MAPSINEELGTEAVIWELADLYQGYDDPAIEEDISRCEQNAGEIQRQYEGRVGKLEVKELVELVGQLEKMSESFGRIATFAYLNFATRANDQQVSAFLQRIREVGSRISKETVFLNWNGTDLTPTAWRHFLSRR